MIEKNLVVELWAFEGVTEAHFIYGPYDVYCISTTKTMTP